MHIYYCLIVWNTSIETVDAVWSEYGDWTDCSETCGGGIRSRSRICSYPDVNNKGNYCVGSSEETESCNTDNCPGRCLVTVGNTDDCLG